MTFLKPEDLDVIRDRLGEKVSLRLIWQNKSTIMLITEDCFLLCIYAILLCIPNISCCFRLFIMDSAGTFFSYLCRCQWPLERSVC